MPGDAFAPSQLYILLGITVATLSWLSNMKGAKFLSGYGVALIVFQVAHLTVATRLPVGVNVMAHAIALMGYMMIMSWLLRDALDARGGPPDPP